MNCFFWDEPWIGYAWSEESAMKSLGTGRDKKQALVGHLPQCYCSLGLYPTMGVGLPQAVEKANID